MFKAPPYYFYRDAKGGIRVEVEVKDDGVKVNGRRRWDEGEENMEVFFFYQQ